MTLTLQIEALEGLAVLDAELAEVQEELGQARREFEAKRQQLAELEAALARTAESVATMDKTRGELALDARKTNQQLSAAREKLARCRNEREINAVQREVEDLRVLFRDRETEVSKLSELSEQARAQLSETLGQKEALAAALGQSEGAAATRLQTLEALVADCAGRREVAVAAVPTAIYRRYEQIRKRIGSALAHVADGTCSACHMKVSPMAYQKLRREGGIEQCPSCNRIVYFKAQATDSAENRSSVP